MGFLSTIVKIIILKIILVTGNLVCSKAIDLQKHSLQSPGVAAVALVLEHLLGWSAAVQSVNMRRL